MGWVLLFSVAASAGQERYEYDPVGRLVRYIDSANQLTEYTYDPAGNILSVSRLGTATAAVGPVLTGVSPSVVRRGQTATLSLSGSRLQVGTLRAADPAIELSNVRQTATQVIADVAVGDSAAIGSQTLTFSSVQGSASIALVVAPRLPTLAIEPSPLALPPDNVSRGITLRLSNADLVSHVVSLGSSDPARISIAAASVTFAVGQTSVVVNVTPKAAGFANIVLTSPTLQTVTAPVFVTADFRGVNTSYAQAVGVVVGDVSATPTLPPITATFASPRVGVTLGPVLVRTTPMAMPVGTTQLFTLSGFALPPGAQVSIVPGSGMSAAITAQSAQELGVVIAADASVQASVRRIVVRDAGGATIPFADPQQSLLHLTTGQPSILSIEPLFGAAGTTLPLRIRGAHLQGGRVVLQPETDIRVDASPVSSADGTELVAQLQLAPFAAPGPRTVQVVTPSGQSSHQAAGANQFSVVGEIKGVVSPIASPLVGVVVGTSTVAGGGSSTVGPVSAAAVGVAVGPVAFRSAPQVGVVGTSLTLVVSGSELSVVGTVTLVPSDGLTVGAALASADGSSLSVPVSIDAAAPRTLRRVVLATATGRLPFAVPSGDQLLIAASAPQLISVAPQVLRAGQTASFTVRGRNFSDVIGVTFDPPLGLTAVPPFAATEGGTVLTFAVQSTASAPAGARTLIVNTAGGASASTPEPGNTFNVAQQVGPTYDAIFATPVGVQVGTTTLAQPTATQAAYAPLVGVVVGSATMAVTSTGVVYAHPVGVVVGAATTGINPSAPDGVLRNTTSTLVVTGVGLGSVSAVTITGPAGLQAGAPVANSEGTQIAVPVSVGSSSASANYGVRITIGTGTAAFRLSPVSGAELLFRVGSMPTAISSVSPIVLEQGKTYTFTVRGIGLADVYQLVTEPEIGLQFDLSSLQWISDALGERLTVGVIVQGSAPIGSRAVRLKVPGGTSSSTATPANTITIVAPQ